MLNDTVTATATAVKKGRQAKAEYQREWRKKNPAKNKQYIRNYWIRKAEKKQINQCDLFAELLKSDIE